MVDYVYQSDNKLPLLKLCIAIQNYNFFMYVISGCPEPSTGTAPYIIILGIIIPLLVLGVLALILLKVLLLVIVSTWFSMT